MSSDLFVAETQRRPIELTGAQHALRTAIVGHIARHHRIERRRRTLVRRFVAYKMFARALSNTSTSAPNRQTCASQQQSRDARHDGAHGRRRQLLEAFGIATAVDFARFELRAQRRHQLLEQPTERRFRLVVVGERHEMIVFDVAIVLQARQCHVVCTTIVNHQTSDSVEERIALKCRT
jgi:hypothetical protein